MNAWVLYGINDFKYEQVDLPVQFQILLSVSMEDFQSKIQNLGRDIKPKADLTGLNKQIAELESKFDKLAIKEENFKLLGKDINGDA